MGSVLQLTKSRGNVLDLKMLFLDTVVMPVLSQMMRGKEILASACCCCVLNTPLFCHQNLHGNTHRHHTCALLGREGITWLEPLPGCKRTAADTALQHRRAPGPQPEVFKQVKPHSMHRLKPSYPDALTPVASGHR